MSFRAPYFHYNDLRREADKFLSAYNPTNAIPVPIEEIAEFQLKLDIVPTPGLRNFSTVAFLSSDLKQIFVDAFVYEKFTSRYRFSLAHEIGHIFLHACVYNEFRFSDISSWKRFISDTIPEDQYGLLEFHANSFAGLVLVPSSILQATFHDYVTKSKNGGVTFSEPGTGTRDFVEGLIAKEFDVSPDVIHKRVEYDKLWELV